MASKDSQKDIYVYAQWQEFTDPELMGILHALNSKGKEIFSFEYDKKWLESGFSRNLDPDLQLFGGPQYLREGKSNFGIFLDSSPDRWGRILMKRRESALAKQENRVEKKLIDDCVNSQPLRISFRQI